MPRAKKPSDSTYNARRRFTRAANRYLDRAANAVGAARQRYMELARDAASKAASLYERKADIQRSKPFERIAERLNININEFLLERKDTQREKQQRETLERQSVEWLSGETGTMQQRIEARREQEAQAILSSPIGSRIYAGTVDIWAQPTYTDEGELVMRRSQEDINQLIMQHYGVNSMMDVIELLEKEIDLYSDPKSLERYDEVSLTIAKGLY